MGGKASYLRCVCFGSHIWGVDGSGARVLRLKLKSGER